MKFHEFISLMSMAALAKSTIVRRSLHGILLSTETKGETTFNSYDAFARVAQTWRAAILAATGTTGVMPVADSSTGTTGILPVASYTYSPTGDLLATHTYTNSSDILTETYAYDLLGNHIATTDAHGNTICRTYDPFGRVLSEWGATYPVRYTYDTQGRRTSLTTFRTTGGTQFIASADLGDTTTWTHDPYTGNCLSKTYADGSTVTYTYTPDNLLLRTTYPSGKWKENVYDAQRRLSGVEYSSHNMDYELQLDAYGNATYASNAVATVAYVRSNSGMTTNETQTVGGDTAALMRSFDGAERLIGLTMPNADYDADYSYDADGDIDAVSNSLAVVQYLYYPDKLEAGYSVNLANGTTIVRHLIHDDYRRSLVTNVTTTVNGTAVETLDYGYDAVSRPVQRNADTFGYNARNEVTSATISGILSAYGYDDIGNSTNCPANCLNQYVPPAGGTPFIASAAYDLDGNMTQCGGWSYTYDAGHQLKSVSSNGVLLVTNDYDARLRRMRKVTPHATTTFFYDDWNIIEERVAYTNGTTSTIRYYWGKDLSGTLQGAGGVGGLLYLTVNGTIYIPCYDNNGNITRYLDASGNTVAQYTYDAFGNLISKAGHLADFFRHRFSTKYLDADSGLYYYGYRFYHPILMRWLNRDPIGEDGGGNLYSFVLNRVSYCLDKLGLYRWVAIYYSRSDQPEFRRAAETYKNEIGRSSTFNSKCDSVIIKGALTADDFRKVWGEVNNETRMEGNQYTIKSLHIFTHSGPGMLFLRGTSLNASSMEKLTRLNWATGGSVVCHGCNTGIHDEDGNSVAKSLAAGQGVRSLGQTGFAQFSENPNRRTWFTRVDSDSQNVYLWSYGDGGQRWTFGEARAPQIEYPPKEGK